MTAHGGWLHLGGLTLTVTELHDLQPQTAHLVEVNVQWVAHRIAGSHDSEFLERAPGAATHLSDYSHGTPKRLVLFIAR